MRHITPLVLALVVAACSAPPSSPTPSVSPSSSSTPAPVSSSRPLPMTSLQGKVYDENQDLMALPATITVRSLNPASPFETSVTTAGGAYAVPQAPVNTQLEVSASREGWTTRKRVVVLSYNPDDVAGSIAKNVCVFGGKDTSVDTQSPAFFLSNRPEIESVTPVDGATSLPNDSLSLEVHLSEALDDTNRRRFAAALTVVPNNLEALAYGTAFNVPAPTPAEETQYGTALDGFSAGLHAATSSPYKLQQNASYLSGLANADLKWDSTGKVLTLKLAAPLKADRLKEAAYAVCLIQADENPIVDPEGNQMGARGQKDYASTAEAQVILNAFQPSSLRLDGVDNLKLEDRLAATHRSFSKFSVKTDTTGLTLTKVLARRNFTDEAGVAYDRIEMKFDAPVAAYPQIAGRAVLSLNNYVLTAGSASEVGNRNLTASSGVSLVGAGTALVDVRTAMKTDRGMAVDAEGPLMATTDGSKYAVTASVQDPTVVILRLPAGALPLDATSIKVLPGGDTYLPSGNVGTFEDFAGNALVGPTSGLAGDIL